MRTGSGKAILDEAKGVIWQAIARTDERDLEQAVEYNRVDHLTLGKEKHAATLSQNTSFLEIFPSAWKFQRCTFYHLPRSFLSGFPLA
jgi:hypothetical protein